jgi:hypothetical protein
MLTENDACHDAFESIRILVYIDLWSHDAARMVMYMHTEFVKVVAEGKG